MAGHPNAVVAFRLSFVEPGSVEPVRVCLHAPHLRPCTSRVIRRTTRGGGAWRGGGVTRGPLGRTPSQASSRQGDGMMLTRGADDNAHRHTDAQTREYKERLGPQPPPPSLQRGNMLHHPLEAFRCGVDRGGYPTTDIGATPPTG